ncbi:MAG: AEC family transporter [Candidatus Bathyarchaeia archaeon]
MPSIIQTILILSGFIGIGLILKFLNLYGCSKPLEVLVNYVMLPSLIISGLIKLQIEDLNEMYPMVFFALFICIVGVSISLILVKCSSLRNEDKGAIVLLSAFHNAIFLPFPIILSVFNDIAYAVFYANASNMACLSIGAILGAYYGADNASSSETLISTIKFPPFLALLIALSIIVLKIELFDGLAIALELAGKPTSYLMLILLGMQLPTEISFSKFFTPLVIVAFVRFIVSPSIGVFLSSAFNLNEVAKGSLIIETSMPPALTNLVIISRYGLNVKMSSTIILLTTVISLIVIYPSMLILL